MNTSPKIWPVRDAKAHFCEFLDACLADGPQIVTQRGAEAAVLVPECSSPSHTDGAYHETK
jgi:prevent-host-death family protein